MAAILVGPLLLAAFIIASCAEYIEERPTKRAPVTQKEAISQLFSIFSGIATDTEKAWGAAPSEQ